MVVQYIVVLIVNYLDDQIKLVLSQLQIAKLSMRVIVNHLNEALFLRTEDGRLSYCNELGTRIIK